METSYGLLDKLMFYISAVYENLNIVEYVTIAVSIHDQTEYNQWPGNVFGNSLLI